ncbi:hypothetical protein H5410_021396 [Solanum commersonii]|uniref:Uncharacterized protein n=1 Tax=Solanum commersonii TaxID=4109 RepID=A0A9J5ZAW3_SOLCO|nr:hypothetical protein H5410_021396 [Solanum commersonii]
MLLKMGYLAHSVNVWASRLEVEVPWMINRAITTALTPFKASIDALPAIFEVFERGQGVSTEVTALKANIFELRKDVDQLKSTDFTFLFGTVEIPNDPSADIPACDEEEEEEEEEKKEDEEEEKEKGKEKKEEKVEEEEDKKEKEKEKEEKEKKEKEKEKEEEEEKD